MDASAILYPVGKAGTTPPKTLALDMSIQPDSLLRKLLALPQALKGLRYHVAWRPECVSPAGLVRDLAPIYQTLVYLGLTGLGATGGKTDASLIDFPCFESLRRLEVVNPFCFLTGKNDTISGRRGFYKRLPVSLEYLQVSEWNSL